MRVQDVRNIYGQSFKCDCGRRHHVEPERVIYADDAIDRLPRVAAAYAGVRDVTVLMDGRTRDVAGAAAVGALRGDGWNVRELLVPDPPAGSPVCDDMTRDDLAGRLGEPALVISIGSGVINDLGKWLAFDRDLPFVTFATAASMNGYTSANVAPAICGVKTLVPARPPRAVLASPRVIREAPREMIAAGLGDVLAKSVSSADWRLNHLLFGEYFCPTAVGLIGEIEPLYLDHPEAVAAGEAQAVDALFEALMLTGVAMTLAGSSAPASGGEHLVSHSLDMMSSLDDRPHDLHGRQVGVGTVLAADVYERLLAMDAPQWREPEMEIDRAFWGRLADVVEAAFDQKRPKLADARVQLDDPAAWLRIREQLPGMLRSSGRIRDCLSKAGAACSAADIGCPRDRLLAAFSHAHEIRSRFTVLDLARLAGLLPDAQEAILDAWA